jgi:transposase
MKTHKSLPELSSHQQQIAEGSLLGDGTLRHNKKAHLWNWNFQKFQSRCSKDGLDKKDFMVWHKKALGLHSASLKRKKRTSLLPNGNQFEHIRYEFETHVHPIWTNLGKKWYLHNDQNNLVYDEKSRKIKIVPRDLKLTPLSTCIWFMDDGSNWSKDANAVFCTHGFSVEDVDFLVDRLKKDVGINCKRRMTKKGQPIIYVGRKGYFDLMDCIRPHMEWKCFSYKVDTSAYKKKSGKGEEHHSAVLNEEMVRNIFSLKSEGTQNKDIASQLGVSQTTITLILNGDRWGHLGLAKEPKRMPKRMTAEQKSQAVNLINDGWLEKDIAAWFKVSQPTINRLKNKLKEQLCLRSI